MLIEARGRSGLVASKGHVVVCPPTTNFIMSSNVNQSIINWNILCGVMIGINRPISSNVDVVRLRRSQEYYDRMI